MQSRVFKCSSDEAKRSFYIAANAIFSKVGRLVSEDVTLQPLKTKCIATLFYDLEAFPLNKSHISSIDFVLNRFFMKLFNTSNIEIVKYCQQEFESENIVKIRPLLPMLSKNKCCLFLTHGVS